jgi:CheY-like chemotaxis protein
MAYAATHPEVRAGQYVMLAVSDTGAGMTPDVIQRAFDPFFTTKPPGLGTGLGLSQVYGFIKQSGGHVSIYSEPDQGTSVKLYLPRFYGEVETPRAAEPAAAPAPSGAGATVLVVEDDDGVRELTVEMLRDLGYRVVAAESGGAALRALDGAAEVALLLTDVVMPDMNGRKLADAALARRPALKVLFTTGYTRNAIVHNGVLDPGVHLIAKPFTVESLAAKIHEVLGHAAAAF